MKNTRACPKCGSKDVVEVPGGAFSPLGQGGFMGTGGFGTARIDRWVCCTCGYSEAWVEPEKLQRIRKNWQKSH